MSDPESDFNPEAEKKAADAAEIHRQAMAIWLELNDGLALVANRRSMRPAEFIRQAKASIEAIQAAMKENPRASEGIVDPFPRATDAVARLTAAIETASRK